MVANCFHLSGVTAIRVSELRKLEETVVVVRVVRVPPDIAP